MDMRRIALVCLALGGLAACNFDGPVTHDAIMDIPPRVQFSFAASVTDEPAGMVNVRVEMNRKSTDRVTVDFSVLEGTAIANVDYMLQNGLTSGTVVFEPGTTVANIPITVIQDFKEEPDETIVLALNNPQHADIGEISKHTVTIAMNLLPRVSFVAATSSANEDVPQQFAINLNTKSPGDVVVSYTVAGSAQNPGDYTGLQPTGQITIPAGQTSVMLDPKIVHDGIDEDDKVIDITMINATNAVIGQFPELQHTILDVDPPPVATISTPAMSVVEGNADHVVNLTVSLSIRSEKTITIPIVADVTSSALDPADYNYVANSITIPPGMTTGTIAINIIGDTIDEPDETVITKLGTPTNATLGTPSTQTLTITDDDLVCFGPLGAFSVCLDRGPTQPVTLPASINTDASGLCAAAQPVGWLGNMQPNSCFVIGTTITGSSTTVSGSRPLVLVASDTITINTLLDASSGAASGAIGPGSPSAACKAFALNPQGNANGGGGGAGASFLSKGGNGASGNAAAARGGTAAAADTAVPTALRAGCNGQNGGNGGNGHPFATVGHGGGVVYLVAGTQIRLNNATINASGGGGGADGSLFSGGSGGGSGGMIKLFAPSIQVNGNTRIVANGGGGSGGGDNNAIGGGGGDPDPSTPSTPAPGGTNTSAGGDGGDGFAGVTAAADGSAGNTGKGGGAGGGGGGYIVSNLALTTAQVSAGRVDAP
jgi:Calx-beta domain-containing protein